MKKICVVFLFLCALNVFCFAQESQENKIILTVDDAVTLAMQENVTIKRQAISLQMLKEKADYSWNSVSPSASVSANFGESFGEINTSQWSVSGSVSIGLSPNLYASIKSAKLNYQNGLITFEQTKQTVELNVRKIFFSLLLSKQSLELQKKNLETARQRYNANREKYNKGQLSELDLLNSQYNYESLKPSVESAEITYENSLASFKLLLGLSEEDEIELNGKLKDYVTKKEISYDVNIDDVPSVQALNRQIELANVSLLSSRFSAYSPSISASYSYGISGRENVPGNSKSNSLSVGVRIPLDGLLPWSSSSINIDTVKSNIQDLELQLDNEKANAKLNIETSFKKIKKEQSQLELLESNIALAQKTYDMTLSAYNHGSRDFLTLQNASVSLLNAQISLEQQRYNFISAVLDLENMLGLPFGTLTK